MMESFDVVSTWIGLTDKNGTGRWGWVDGWPVTFTLWDKYEEWDFDVSWETYFEASYDWATGNHDNYSYWEFELDYYWYDSTLYEYGCIYHYVYVDGTNEYGSYLQVYDYGWQGASCANMWINGEWFMSECDRARDFVCDVPRENASVCHSDLVTSTDPTWDIVFPVQHQSFLTGLFKGMPDSPGIVRFENMDPFFGQFEFEILLDEVELWSKAGQLRGTVGVEHTVDTFLGLANFRPTGITALDTFATQTAIHLEKTSFFTMASHGVNDYTFLEYINMRLVAVYTEDTDFSGSDEAASRTVRTVAGDAAHFVQVTFTLGAQYGVNQESTLVPLESVRAGRGTFFDEAALVHTCSEWLMSNFSRKTDFVARLEQGCAPAVAMCASPASVPDSFVAFNIPLGFDFYGLPSNSLDNNVFMDMVISVIDTSAPATAGGSDDPMQVKTTLTSSIPVVVGGINIFCDGFTAKTDLKDVANADIVVGSASDAHELSRLRILRDIASTQLSVEGPTQIDSSSIESGLLTLVLKGNAAYFGLGARSEVSIELEDVITIHVMEDDGDPSNSSLVRDLLQMIAADPADNSNSSGLLTDGYALNDAFFFTIDRAAQRAHLEPSLALLDKCPFNPPPPASSNVQLLSCVLRRDVRHRGFPARTGSLSTAMEICKAANPHTSPCSSCCAGLAGDASEDESKFMASVLGASDYAHQLAAHFAQAIDASYGLNGRYRRAFWINPGYEWTPTQTGGQSVFSLSQQLLLFALILLDENIADVPGPAGQEPILRRRMLLSASPLKGRDGRCRSHL